MEIFNTSLEFRTNGKGFIDITENIATWIVSENILRGNLVISSLHTSCSLIINENADPNVLSDLLAYMDSLVPERKFASLNNEILEKQYKHSDEGLDDMPAHIKTMLTSTSLNLIIQNKKILLGTWQSIFLWEHRCSYKKRLIHLQAIGLKSKNI